MHDVSKQVPSPDAVLRELEATDGEVTFVVTFLLFHHALRRDAGQLAAAFARSAGSEEGSEALRYLWGVYAPALRGHHELEDRNLFPMLVEREPSLAGAVAALEREHEALHPLLHALDDAIAQLPAADAARAGQAAANELDALLLGHLASEEELVLPSLRRSPPAPPPQRADPRAFGWLAHALPPALLDVLRARLLPEEREALDGWHDAHDARVAACLRA